MGRHVKLGQRGQDDPKLRNGIASRGALQVIHHSEKMVQEQSTKISGLT